MRLIYNFTKEKMSDFSYTIRNYQPADFNRFVKLRIEAGKLEPTRRPLSPQTITESLGRPNYSPERDLFLVEIAGALVGYMDIQSELTIGRVILTGWIRPEHRRKGLAAKLLGYATHRANELGAKVTHVNILEDNKIAKSVLSKLGFKYVRREFEMRLDMSRVRQKNLNQAASKCRCLLPGEEDRLVYIQNLSFTGSWGFNPNTIEELTYWTGLSHRSPEDVVLACDDDEVIGYCWTEVYENQEEGQILMIGTDPAYRGRGIGKRVLLAGLAYLKNRGVKVTSLNVDSENKVAYALYQSVGFEVRTSWLWYEKMVD